MQSEAFEGMELISDINLAGRLLILYLYLLYLRTASAAKLFSSKKQPPVRREQAKVLAVGSSDSVSTYLGLLGAESSSVHLGSL
jgi:hypothetical protein